MGQVPCARCGALTRKDALVLAADGEVCPSCELDSATSFGGSANITGALITGALLALAPCFVSWKTGSGLSSFGVGLMTNLLTSGADHVAFVGGLGASLAGAWVIWRARQQEGAIALLLAGVGIAAFGAVQLFLRSGYLY